MSEMTVASTTDTQDEINLAAGAVTAKPEVVEAKEGEEPEQEQGSEPEKHGKSGYQKRIDKLTREKYETRQALEKLQEEVEALKSGKPKEEVKQPDVETKSDDRPKPEDLDDKGNPKYATYEDFVEALTDWKTDKNLQKRQQEAERTKAEQAETAKLEAMWNAHQERLKEAYERYDDFEEMAERVSKTPIDAAISNAIIELENGPDVLYHLAKNPKLVTSLSKMSDTRAVAEIGRISAMLEEPEQEEAAIPVKRAGPAPIRPVGGNATKSSLPLDELDYQTYRRVRDQQEKQRYRR
jgi:hypothetical protein